MLAREPVKTSNLFSSLSKSAASVSSSSASLNASPHGSDRKDNSSFSFSSASAAAAAFAEAKKKKNKKKKKSNKAKASATSAVEAASDQVENDESCESTEVTNDTGSQSSEPSDGSDPSQLPLTERLEIAAAHPDVHAALVGLLGWSRLYLNTDTILTFFQCSALDLLLENLLRSLPVNDVIYDNLTQLLSNCLYVERDGKALTSNREIAVAVVQTVRSIVTKLRNERNSLVSTEKLARQLSKTVLNYHLCLNDVTTESSLLKEVLRIESQIAQAAAKDGQVQGQTIRDSFQRRDIRSDAISLYKQRLVKINKLVQENVLLLAEKTSASDDDKAGDGVESRAASEFQRLFEEEDVSFDPNQMDIVKAQMDVLIDNKNKKLEPLETKKQMHQRHIEQLKQQREKLEAQLKQVNDEIDDLVVQETDVDEQIAQVEKSYAAEICQFDQDHQHVIRLYERKQQIDAVAKDFEALEKEMTKITLAHSEVQSLKAKRVVCLRQQFEALLRYFASELLCVDFMKNRVRETQAKLDKSLSEAEAYKALGAGAVANEITSSTEQVRGLLEEDVQCLRALEKRDEEILKVHAQILSDETLKEPIQEVPESLVREVQRHADYLQKIYNEIAAANVNPANDSEKETSSSSPTSASTSAKKHSPQSANVSFINASAS